MAPQETEASPAPIKEAMRNWHQISSNLRSMLLEKMAKKIEQKMQRTTKTWTTWNLCCGRLQDLMM
jgi:hypothetical protein